MTFTARWATRFVRLRADALLRALTLQTAIEPGDAHAEAKRVMVERFQRSLPTAGSRWITIAAIILIVVVFQLAFAAVTYTGFGGTAGPVSDVLGESATGDPGSVGKLVDRLSEADPIDLLGLFSVASFSVYLVLRAPAVGYRRAQRLLAFSEQDAKTYGQLGAHVPPDPPFDLAVKALFAVGIILYGLVAISYQTQLGGFSGYVGAEIYAAAVIGCLGVLRLVWIGWRWYRTGSSLAPFLAACTVVTALGIAGYVSSLEKAGDGFSLSQPSQPLSQPSQSPAGAA